MGKSAAGGLIAGLAALQIACSSATSGPGARAPSPDGLSAAQMEEIYRARIERDRGRFTGADVRFMTDMIQHHAQAVEMSRMVPSRTESSSIRVLAARIINAQMDEIAIMQRWLRDRGQPAPEVHITDTQVMVHGVGGDHAAHAGHAMPGMVSAEQMRALEQARGEQFDRQFLTLMIEHHRGAVTMVRELFATDGAGQDEAVFKFASDVQVDQSTEVARMELMLRGMDGRE